MPQISLNCSSFVGQQAQYQADWTQSVAAVNQFYQPLETFGDRFVVMLAEVVKLGFGAVDIWTAGQLNWAWATPQHIKIAHDLFEKHHLQVASLGGEFGETRAEFDSACRMAVGVGTSLLSGTLPLLFEDRDYVVQGLREYGLQLAIENHPESHPGEMLDKIGDSAGGLIGTTVDTGWYATRGYDAARAIADLKDHLLHVHLKDVLAGDAHINCGYGKGIVDIQRCVTTLKAIGYQGDISVENHTTDHDPADELVAGLQLVTNALA
jgi:L-ribulose-5-phosphate 3-epimerase